jgi:thymidylate synthase (FAD)
VKVKLIWSTPNGEQLVADMARVSAPENIGMPSEKLIGYLVRNQHWSPFEMVNVCFEIETTRDIARQILRHRSFSFQEFSQRYAAVDKMPEAPLREARLQDTKNRQNSLQTDDGMLHEYWSHAQGLVDQVCMQVYKTAIEKGIAKEVARAVLPEGLTASRMYMNGTLRSWMHYCKLRTGNGTQKEHMEIAKEISDCMAYLYPSCWQALMEN